jgi:hypothetical protein
MNTCMHHVNIARVSQSKSFDKSERVSWMWDNEPQVFSVSDHVTRSNSAGVLQVPYWGSDPYWWTSVEAAGASTSMWGWALR